LGYYADGKLTYCGRVGTGFTNQSLADVHKELMARRTSSPPYDAPLPAAARRGVTWVRPELVCEARFSEWTSDGILRHPSFQGLRQDKSPRQIVREQPQAMPSVKKHHSRASHDSRPINRSMPSKRQAARARRSTAAARVDGVRITNPERIVYPELGITKHSLAEYYAQVADWILPHVANRPLTVVRCPKGLDGHCFFQKHLSGYVPEAVESVLVREEGGRGKYITIRGAEGLLGLVQIGVLEMHPWPARSDNVERPDRLIIDLDPGEGTPWSDVVAAARDVRDRLERLGLESFLRTTGGKGLHVVAPLERRNTWDELRDFAQAIAMRMAREEPQRYVAKMTKSIRRGKVYVDYLRNQRGATAIASYSTRARIGAPVATPLAWKELTARTVPGSYTVTSVPRRLANLSDDPWTGFDQVRQSITRAMIEQGLGNRG
jgi:bifunctional non-homologous end joining protein LigD